MKLTPPDVSDSILMGITGSCKDSRTKNQPSPN